MTHTCSFGKTALPVGGTHVTAGWAGLILVKLETRWRSAQRTVSCGKEPMAEQKKETPLPEGTEERSRVMNWLKHSQALSPCAVGGKEGGDGEEKRCLKGLFSSSLSYSVNNKLTLCL